MNKITAALLGAGQRGMDCYGQYALHHPGAIHFTAVAESNPARLQKFGETHRIDPAKRFTTWNQLLEQPQLADVILICTQDKMHFEPALQALKKGYHILLEKPMSPDPLECLRLGEAADKANRIFLICHVLRYTDFFATIKKLLDQGRIGKLISIQHNENVAHWHQAHSFVRGNWRRQPDSGPMILTKCCHDLDIMLWLAGADCVRLSSFGSLTHFKKENASRDSPERCLDGCPIEEECPYYAPKIYLTENTGWPASVISDDPGYEARLQALREGPYGRCVYRCDNDVVDHQVVNLEFANEVTASFTMCAFTYDCSRTIKLMGTRGELRGAMEKNEIEILDFVTIRKERIHLNESQSGHGGGDFGLMRDFIRLVRSGSLGDVLTSARISVQSHLMAFAAEKSRLEGKVIEMEGFVRDLGKR